MELDVSISALSSLLVKLVAFLVDFWSECQLLAHLNLSLRVLFVFSLRQSIHRIFLKK